MHASDYAIKLEAASQYTTPVSGLSPAPAGAPPQAPQWLSSLQSHFLLKLHFYLQQCPSAASVPASGLLPAPQVDTFYEASVFIMRIF